MNSTSYEASRYAFHSCFGRVKYVSVLRMCFLEVNTAILIDDIPLCC